MSQENVEIMREVINAFNAGDFDAALKYASPDFEMDLSRAIGPQHGVFSLPQVKGFWAEFADAWESFRLEPHEFIDAGEHVVVPWTIHGRGRGGIEVSSDVAWVWTFHNGAVTRGSMYQERREALDAVGLSE
jgi:ketosteroid isomerase-like protein